MLKTVYMEFGMAIGLFAIFTILRFRTRNFSIKDMTYIVTIIAISVVNSFKLVGFPTLGVLIFNMIIILSAFILEEFLARNKSVSHTIIYDNLELLKPDKKEKLLKDISLRTGKEIQRIKIRRIDFNKETARVEIYYKENSNGGNKLKADKHNNSASR